MFREMRRIKQLLTNDECIAVLRQATAGVLAVNGDDDYPYTVPLSFLYDDDKLYFHCAKEGHKLDGIKRNAKVSFCVTDMNRIVPEEYTTYFRSVILFGTARILEEEAEKRNALEKLAARYSPDHEEGRLKEIDGQIKHTCMVEISIDHMTGKEAIELIRAKGKE